MTTEASSAVSADGSPQSATGESSDGAAPRTFAYLSAGSTSNGNGASNGAHPELAARPDAEAPPPDADPADGVAPAEAVAAAVSTEPSGPAEAPADLAEAPVDLAGGPAEASTDAPADLAEAPVEAGTDAAADLAEAPVEAGTGTPARLAEAPVEAGTEAPADVADPAEAALSDVAVSEPAADTPPADLPPAEGVLADGEGALADGEPGDGAVGEGVLADEVVAAEVAEQLGAVVGEDVEADPAEFAAAAVLDVLRASGWADATEAGELRAEANRLRELLAEVIRDHRAREASMHGVENQQLHWLVPLLRAAHGVAFGSLGAKVALRTAVQEVPPEVLASAGLRIDYGVEPAYEDDRER